MNRKQAAVAIFVLAGLLLLGVAAWRSTVQPGSPAAGTPAPAAAMPAPVRAEGVPAPDVPTTARREAVATAEARVFGQVVDVAGVPIRDAVLSLFDFASQRTFTAPTDAGGAYEFAESRGSTGLFQLAIEKTGYGRSVAAEVHASLLPRRDVLATSLIIRGRVSEAGDGRPVPAFRVLATRLPFQDEGQWDEVLALHRQAIPEDLRAGRALDVAEPTGTFCLRDLAAGKYALLIAAPGREPLFYNGGGKPWDMYRGVEARPEPEAQVAEIALPPAGVAIIEVVERNGGLPVREARVASRVSVGHGEFTFGNARAVPAASNRFELPIGLDARGCIYDCECVVMAPGFAPNRVSAGGQDNGHVFVIELGRPATVRGLVRDAQGNPLPGAVILVERESDAGLAGSARTAADGRYEVGDLDAPRAQVLCCLSPALGSVLATVPLQLADGETRVVDVGGQAAGGLYGRVAVLGQPLQEAWVWLDPAGGKLCVHCTTRADGAFAFAGLRQGRHELKVSISLAGRNLLAERTIEIGASTARVDFDFGRRVTGVVVRLGHTTADEKLDAEVVARRLDAPGPSGRTDLGDDGRFDLLIAEPGVYELTVDGGEFWETLAPREVDLRTATLVDGVELQVARDSHEGRIELRFVDAATGQPAAGSVEWSHRHTYGESDLEAGLFVEEHAGLGHYRFRVVTEEYAPATVDLDVTVWQPRVERRIALAPAQAVQVTDVEPAGAAHRAGIKAGDLLQRYGTADIHSVTELHAAIASATGVVTIVVERDGAGLALTAEAGELGVEVKNVR